MIKLNRSSLYYKPVALVDMDIGIMNSIDKVYTIHPYYGYRRMYYELKSKGYSIGKRKIVRFMKLMNIKALYPKKKINTSIPDKHNKKYPYLLKNMDIEMPNQVTGIRYIIHKTK